MLPLDAHFTDTKHAQRLWPTERWRRQRQQTPMRTLFELLRDTRNTTRYKLKTKRSVAMAKRTYTNEKIAVTGWGIDNPGRLTVFVAASRLWSVGRCAEVMSFLFAFRSNGACCFIVNKVSNTCSCTFWVHDWTTDKVATQKNNDVWFYPDKSNLFVDDVVFGIDVEEYDCIVRMSPTVWK